MRNANDFRCGTDSETLELAVRNRTADGIVVIPPRVSDVEYGTNQPESMSGVTISNVICNSSTAITVAGFLKDSVISNDIFEIMCYNSKHRQFRYAKTENERGYRYGFESRRQSGEHISAFLCGRIHFDRYGI